MTDNTILKSSSEKARKTVNVFKERFTKIIAYKSIKFCNKEYNKKLAHTKQRSFSANSHTRVCVQTNLQCSCSRSPEQEHFIDLSESCSETDRVLEDVVACLAIRPQLQNGGNDGDSDRYARPRFYGERCTRVYPHTHAYTLGSACIESYVRVRARSPISNSTFNYSTSASIRKNTRLSLKHSEDPRIGKYFNVRPGAAARGLDRAARPPGIRQHNAPNISQMTARS